MLEVSPRTLNEWKRSVARSLVEARLGRPRRPVAFTDILKIAREWKRQGFAGARAVSVALPNIPVRLVRETIAKLKLRFRSKLERRRLRMRTSISVAKPGQLLAIDATLMRDGKDVLVARDRASLLTYVQPCRKRAKTYDTIKLLTDLEKRQRLPLVLASDNGGAFTSTEVRDYCKRKKIVLLRSLPRTPQHNGACEIAVREVKETMERVLDIDRTCLALNEGRKRKRLGYQTAFEFDQTHFVHYSEAARAELYCAVGNAIAASQLGTERAYEKRKMEREAILRTLERFKLIQITRGDQLARSKSEDIT